MASILDEYLKRRLSIVDLKDELKRLIKEYNKHTGKYLFIYASDLNKGRVPDIDISLIMDDFYNIQDILRESKVKELDFYIETPGGSGEAAEEIAKFLRTKFDEVNFVIAGEAKSAGTILALSGDNIFMTDTGSLGPIDAQVRIGRSVVSAHDYKEWVDEKRIEAEKNGKLNPFDAVIIAQISPGELYGIVNSLEFAKDLVKSWLEEYKFKNWSKTRGTNKNVTPEMKKNRANEVAEMLCNHTTWRTHGRSLKIEDLQEKLIIDRIEDDPKYADIVYRIKTVLRLIMSGSTIYKIFATDELDFSKTYTVSQNHRMGPIPSTPPFKQNPIDFFEVDAKCPKCGKIHSIPVYLDVPDNLKSTIPNNKNIKNNELLECDNCKFTIDLRPLKNNIEVQTKRKAFIK